MASSVVRALALVGEQVAVGIRRAIRTPGGAAWAMVMSQDTARSVPGRDQSAQVQPRAKSRGLLRFDFPLQHNIGDIIAVKCDLTPRADGLRFS